MATTAPITAFPSAEKQAAKMEEIMVDFTEMLKNAKYYALNGEVTLEDLFSKFRGVERDLIKVFVDHEWDSKYERIAPIFWTAPENVNALCRIAQLLAALPPTKPSVEARQFAFIQTFIIENLFAHAPTQTFQGLATVYNFFIQAYNIYNEPSSLERIYIDGVSSILLRILRGTMHAIGDNEDALNARAQALDTELINGRLSITQLPDAMRTAGHEVGLIRQVQMRCAALVSEVELGEAILSHIDAFEIGDAGYAEDLALTTGKMPSGMSFEDFRAEHAKWKAMEIGAPGRANLERYLDEQCKEPEPEN